MNVRNLLDSFLAQGQSAGKQGGDFSAEQFGQSQGGTQQNDMFSNMGKGALAAGALALLLGSKKGRKFTKGALKVGSVAALGGLAYTAYNQWKGGQGQNTQDPQAASTAALNAAPNINLSAEQQQFHDMKLLQAIIAAAKADGHIDDNERAAIEQQMEKIGSGSDVSAIIQQELNKPLNPADIAAGIDSPELAAEVYMVSKMLTDESNFMERTYLNELTTHLQLAPDLVTQLNAQIGV